MPPTQAQTDQTSDPVPPRSRVPVPTAAFWAAKAASTALGEAVSDYSIRIMPPEVAVLLGFAFFVGAVGFQLTRHRYRPRAYWLAVAAVGVFGTMAADVMLRRLVEGDECPLHQIRLRPRIVIRRSCGAGDRDEEH